MSKELNNNLEWRNKYEEYLTLRDKGLRKNAQAELIKFFIDFKEQHVSVRRAFIDEIYLKVFITKNYSQYLPYNLTKELIQPEITNWIKEEPNNPIPLRWSGDMELIRKALEIDPHDQITIDLFGSRLFGGIGMNQHEIASGYPYDGDPNADVEKLLLFEPYLNNIQDEIKRKEMMEIYEDLLETALKYCS